MHFDHALLNDWLKKKRNKVIISILSEEKNECMLSNIINQNWQDRSTLHRQSISKAKEKKNLLFDI
jgi:hypothetical protein